MTGREVMDNLRRAITAVAEYRNNNATINDNENLRQEAYKQTQKLRDAWSELEKIFGLKATTVRFGSLTLEQLHRICSRYEFCEECSLRLIDEDDNNIHLLCHEVIGCNRGSFDPRKLVTIFEEDLK